MLRETIFNLKDLSDIEKETLLYPSCEIIESRMNDNEYGDELGKLLTKDEYYELKTKEQVFYDLFWVFRHRGDFEKARKYEILAKYDAILSMEDSDSDCFMQNEFEYYEWRKKNP
jgi:ethanolamine utilization cobalamin adenosyltransferase